MSGENLRRSILFVLVFPLSASAAGVSGIVLDPQGLAIPDVKVELRCDDHAESTLTNRHGLFAFSPPSPSIHCRVTVARRGFEPVDQAAAPDGTTLTVQLHVAKVAEVVTVHAEDRPTPSFLGGLPFDGDFTTIAGNTADLVRYSRLFAGATTLPSVVYVDGLPATSLPPIETISHISVNADPFSAEYADGDVTTIRLITRAPARILRVNAGGDLLGLGARDILAADAKSDSRSWNAAIRGPVPKLPLTFSFNTSRTRISTALAIQAALPASERPLDDDGVAAVSRSGTNAMEVFYSPSERNRLRVSYRQSDGDASNQGAGGLVLPESGSATSFRARELRATLTRTSPRYAYETGGVVTDTASTTRANTEGPQISVLGSLTRGGAFMRAIDSERQRWTVRQSLRSSASQPWTVGLALSGMRFVDRQQPNPFGLIQFESIEGYGSDAPDAVSGTLFVTRGNGTVALNTVTVAPFFEKVLVSGTAGELRGGIRADYQSRYGTLVSPRLSFAGRWRWFDISAGAGVFARSIPDIVLINAVTNDGRHLQQFMATGVTVQTAADALLMRQPEIRSRIAAGLDRPREYMERVLIHRSFGQFIPSLEYTWTQGRKLLGSERLADSIDWVDIVESNRAQSRHRLHLQLQHTWKTYRAAVHYEWVHARDNTDGPFSFPEQPGNLAAEWARSAGVPSHSVNAAGSFRLPGAISVNLTDTWHGSTPYNITSAVDRLGNGLRGSRQGRSRNSGNGPRFNSLSLYGSRHIPIKVPGRANPLSRINVGVQADNLLGNRNYWSLGSIVGSATFGRPLGALPGRSVRVLLNVD